MDFEKAYSNPADQAKRLRSLLELPHAAGPRAANRATKQAQKRLNGDEVAQLVAAHQAGAGVKELAKRFGIHRATVSDILRREGALRAPGIQPDDVPEVIRLYEDGWSLAQLGEKFHVSAGTVSRALRAEGVTIRQPGGQASSAWSRRGGVPGRTSFKLAVAQDAGGVQVDTPSSWSSPVMVRGRGIHLET